MRIMKNTITAKVRLYPTEEQAKQFKAVTVAYRELCNVVSQWYFDNRFKVNRKKFNTEMYHALRQQMPELNSAMVQSVYRTVEARYKTVKTQLQQHPYHYQDVNTGKWYQTYQTLEWLRKPIRFKRPQADYVRNINYSFVQKGTKISMNVLGKRIKVAFNGNYLDFFDPSYKLGTAKLVQLKNHWFLHIPVTIQSDDWAKENNQHVIGIDRGLRQIMTTYDEQGKTNFFNGRKVAYIRKKYYHLRKQQLSGRENRWMTDVNHQLSKTLVQKYGSNTLFVIEDLTGVNFNRDDLPKTLRHQNSSWSFYQLEQFLTYKALQNHSKVLKVPAAYTSQRCPKCGVIKKSNRNHDTHLYHCDNCNYSSNDDRIGAMNIQILGTLYTTGTKHPKFIKDKE